MQLQGYTIALTANIKCTHYCGDYWHDKNCNLVTSPINNRSNSNCCQHAGTGISRQEMSSLEMYAGSCRRAWFSLVHLTLGAQLSGGVMEGTVLVYADCWINQPPCQARQFDGPGCRGPAC